MDLKEIVECFNAPIKEEQAWAVCHQCGKFLKKQEIEHLDTTKPVFTAPEGPKNIYFNENGHVDLLGPPNEFQEQIALARVGVSVFSALDFGLDEQQEQEISLSLEDLISRMTSVIHNEVDDDNHDEGYDDEKANTEELPCSVDDLISCCENRLSGRWEAESHYTAVCTAMLREAQELKVFLSKVQSANQSLRKLTQQATSSSRDQIHGEIDTDDIPNLGFAEWAHLWMQVLDQLRRGVTRLKKVDQQTRSSVEFELTPYEILMEDIRQKKYTLRKVTTDDILAPLVKKSAHDVILEFIRSRPNLSPAHKRILAPTPPRSKSLHEQLIEQIHEHSVPLKPVPFNSMKSSRTFDAGPPVKDPVGGVTSSVSCRRILKLENFSDCDDDDDGSLTESDIEYDVTGDLSDVNTSENLDDSYSPLKRFNRTSPSPRSSGTSGVSSSSGDVSDGTEANTHRPLSIRFSDSIRRKRLLPLELPPSPAKTPTDSPVNFSSFVPSFLSKLPSHGLRRSQSVALRSNLTQRPSLMGRKITWLETSSTDDVTKGDVKLPPTMRPPVTAEEKRQYFRRTKSERRKNSTLEDEWRQPVASLSLTVEEVMHIRQVLTRAELERYQPDKELYHALKHEKICFNCRTKKFSVFSWPYTCGICKMKVCSKCTKKIRAPTDKYIETPVFTLSPSLHKLPSTRSAYSFTRGDSVGLPNSPITLLRQQYQRDSGESLTSQIWNRSRKIEVCCECHVLLSGVVKNSREVARQNIYSSNAS
uniref:protein spire homolog 2 n=1 Tax=Ciona intestinalis TaxID=7719 RepID=UPI00005211F5|nr:protein spire homolog 2 [Ciona intestinalis]|eukprot:XP_002131893.1 protein spire homolog 2 [Ciona intestinalis]